MKTHTIEVDEATATTLRRAERRFTFDAMMRSAKFNSDPVADASIRNALIASLSRTDTVYLLEHFQDAIEDDDLAKAYAVKVEFESRPKLSEGAKARFAKLMEELTDLKMPHVEEVQRSFRRAVGLVGISETRYREFLTGRSDPENRLTAFRMAGKPRAA